MRKVTEAYSSADTAVAAPNLLYLWDFEGEFEGAAMAIALVFFQLRRLSVHFDRIEQWEVVAAKL